MRVRSTQVTNLVRATESGIFYVRAKIRGRLVWRSLDTTTFAVAKLRLPDELKKLRDAVPDKATLAARMTFGEAVELYKQQIKENPRLKPRAKDFRLRSEFTLRRTWPQIFDFELRRITVEACKAWLRDFENGASRYRPPQARLWRKGNSPTTVNAAIAFLRHVFEIGRKSGILYQNPANELTLKRPVRKLLRLPNRSQFSSVVSTIRSTPGWGRKAGDLVEGLAYSGARIGEIRKIDWSHVDFEKGMIAIPGEKTDAAPRVIPMNGNLIRLLVRMRADRTVTADMRVFEIAEASESLAGACRKVGISHMTHHDLRHLFATTCIESGVDIPTVSRWLGHSDGGALAMRTYGHLRPEHSVEAAKKVRFD